VALDQEQHALLARQSLLRPLSSDEMNLARALESIFASGQRDLGEVVGLLQAKGIKRPSGGAGPWTLQVLEEELATINQELDRLYRNGGRELP
jgi:hypothetical protein